MTTVERDKLLQKIDKHLDRIDIQLNGNGTKGAFKRIDEIEGWKDSRPKVCPAQKPDKKTIVAMRSLEVAIISLVFGSVFKVLEIIWKWIQSRGAGI